MKKHKSFWKKPNNIWQTIRTSNTYNCLSFYLKNQRVSMSKLDIPAAKTYHYKELDVQIIQIYIGYIECVSHDRLIIFTIDFKHVRFHVQLTIDQYSYQHYLNLPMIPRMRNNHMLALIQQCNNVQQVASPLQQFQHLLPIDSINCQYPF